MAVQLRFSDTHDNRPLREVVIGPFQQLALVMGAFFDLADRNTQVASLDNQGVCWYIGEKHFDAHKLNRAGFATVVIEEVKEKQ